MSEYTGATPPVVDLVDGIQGMVIAVLLLVLLFAEGSIEKSSVVIAEDQSYVISMIVLCYIHLAILSYACIMKAD